MLALLTINGAHITGDAMNAPKKIARKIHAQGGADTLCIKANHKTRREAIKAYFHQVKRDDGAQLAIHEAVNGGPGRVEKRVCRQLRVTPWLSEATPWAGLQTVIEMERERQVPGSATTVETQYSTSSLPVAAARVAPGIRHHWEVANKVHWVPDVALKEDDGRIRRGDGAENVGIYRCFCLNLARLHPQQNSLRGKLKQAGWRAARRAEILFGQAT